MWRIWNPDVLYFQRWHEKLFESRVECSQNMVSSVIYPGEDTESAKNPSGIV